MPLKISVNFRLLVKHCLYKIVYEIVCKTDLLETHLGAAAIRLNNLHQILILNLLIDILCRLRWRIKMSSDRRKMKGKNHLNY